VQNCSIVGIVVDPDLHGSASGTRIRIGSRSAKITHKYKDFMF
jgi:hypothetical protein